MAGNDLSTPTTAYLTTTRGSTLGTQPVELSVKASATNSTRSVNPFIASTPEDKYILDNIYDRLDRPNPYMLLSSSTG